MVVVVVVVVAAAAAAAAAEAAEAAEAEAATAAERFVARVPPRPATGPLCRSGEAAAMVQKFTLGVFKFRSNVLRVQHVRDFYACRHARLFALELCWNRMRKPC